NRASRTGSGSGKCLFEFVAMSGRGTKHSYNVNRTGTLSRIVEAQCFGKLGPGRATYKGVTVPGVEIAGTRRRRSAGGIDGSFGSEMLDDSVVPVFATLMTKYDVVSRHGRSGVALFEEVALLCAFSKSGFGQVDVVKVSTSGRLGGQVRHGRNGNKDQQCNK